MDSSSYKLRTIVTARDEVSTGNGSRYARKLPEELLEVAGVSP